MYGSGRQQIVAGRAQIVAGLEDELMELAGYGYAGAAPLPPGHPAAPMMHPAAPMMHPGYGHPAPPMSRHWRGRHGHYHDVHPWNMPDAVDMPIPGAPAVAYSRGPVRVVDEPPRHERQFPIGFTSPSDDPVPANSIELITSAPQVIFRSERLAVPNSIVLNFQLTDIKVGKDSQLAAPGNMPTECFSNISIGVRMQLDTAEPGITVTVLVENTDANNAHAFSAVIYGTVVE